VLFSEVLFATEIRASLEEWETVCRANANNPAILKGEDGAISGARNLLRMWPNVVELVRRPRLLEALEELLGPEAGVVRALFFDKPPGRGWALPWHKDVNIAVRTHGRLGVFSKPTTKAGVPHVEAPVELLEQMITIRIHLDDMDAANGPLLVIPGSHREDGSREPAAIHCRAGDVLFIRPLLTHASAHREPSCTRHRRILHIECAPNETLADGYEWQDFVQLRGKSVAAISPDSNKCARSS